MCSLHLTYEVKQLIFLLKSPISFNAIQSGDRQKTKDCPFKLCLRFRRIWYPGGGAYKISRRQGPWLALCICSVGYKHLNHACAYDSGYFWNSVTFSGQAWFRLFWDSASPTCEYACVPTCAVCAPYLYLRPHLLCTIVHVNRCGIATYAPYLRTSVSSHT